MDIETKVVLHYPNYLIMVEVNKKALLQCLHTNEDGENVIKFSLMKIDKDSGSIELTITPSEKDKPGASTKVFANHVVELIDGNSKILKHMLNEAISIKAISI